MALRREERGMVVGGVETGKSTLAEQLARNFMARYPAKGRRLTLDSKPRYKAEWWLNGVTTKRHYRRWRHGEFVPGSVLITPQSDPDPRGALKDARKLGFRTVIASTGTDIAWLVECCRCFIEDSRADEPFLVHCDETMDFYHKNGAPIGGNAIDRSARAARELGGAGLYCTQRTQSISTTLMQEMSRLYCFRLDYLADVKRFADFGCPLFTPPQLDYVFRYWYKKDRRHVWGPYKLDLVAA